MLAACLLLAAQLSPVLAAIVNSVTVTGTADGVTITTTTNATVTVARAAPRLSLFKTGAFNDGGDGKPDVGDVISYRFTVSNTGNVSLRNIRVTDPLVTVSGGPLSVLVPGQTDTTTFTAVYTITQADIDRGAVSNTASVNGSDPGGTTVSAVDGDTTALVASTGLTLAKAGVLNDGGDNRADAGDTILYQFVVTNTGPATLTNVKVSDPLLDFASRAAAGRALAALGDMLQTGGDGIATAALGEGLRTTIVDDTATAAVSPPSRAFAATSAASTKLPPVPMGLSAARRLVQLSGTNGHPQQGDRVAILYALTNTGDVPLFRLKVQDGTSQPFNDSLDQLDPGATETASVIFTRELTKEELASGSIDAPSVVSATARNEEVRVSAGEPLLLAGMESADSLETAAISPAAVTSLAPGAQAVFQATYVLTQADIDAGRVDNTAVASGTDGGGATLVSVDTAEVLLPAMPGIALVKTGAADLGADNQATIGDTVTYRFAVTNTGNVTLANLTIADPLVTVTGGPIAALPPGATDGTTFTASHVLTQADLDAGEIVNQATVTARTPGGTDISDISGSTSTTGDDPTITTLAPKDAVAVVKTVSGVTDVNANGVPDAGDQISYAFAVTNTGNVTLANVTVSDPLAVVTGGPIPSLAPGETNSVVFRASHILIQADIDAGQVENQATATAVGLGGRTVTDLSDPASLTGDQPTVTAIAETAGVALVKTVSAITDTNGNGVNDAGDIVHYAFAVTNTGSVTLANVVVTDPLASVAGNHIASLPPGATDTTTFTARYVITTADQAAGRITNQATVTATTPSGRSVSDLSDNARIDENDPTITPVTDLPAIALLKQVEAITDTNGNGLTDAGDTISYGFTVINTGNVPLNAVTIQDPLVTVAGGPIAVLDAGKTDSTTFTATYVIRAADIVAGRVSNQATAYGTTALGKTVSDLSDAENPGENDPTVTYLASAPAIAVVKTVSSISDVNANGITDSGDIIDYRFAVTNAGNVTLSNVTVRDAGAVVSGGPLASLAVSQTDAVTFSAQHVITQADVDAGAFSNQATALGTTPGDVLVTDLSDATSISADQPTVTAISRVPAIALVKTVARTIDRNGNGITDAGDEIDYAFAVTNTGNQTLTNIAVADPLVAVAGGPLASLLPGVADASTFTARYAITAGDALAGRVSNQATASAVTLSGTRVSDLSDDADLAENDPTVVAVARLTPHLSKTALDPEVRRGERARFVIVASNAGPGPLQIADVAPPGFTFVKGSATANGVRVAPAIDGRRLVFDGLMPGPSGVVQLKLALRASTSLQSGRVMNRAELRDAGAVLLATAQAAVTIMEEHVFDCGDVIGRVFDDANRNGYADDGEEGLPGVRIATVKGLLVTTDRHGRFHVPCADVPDAATGSNFLMKLDTRTLPTGYVMTSENPREVRLTRGKVTKLNFAASLMRQVELQLADEAFLAGGVTLKPQWREGVAQLLAVLEQQPSILNLTYQSNAAASDLVGKRLAAVKSLIAGQWKQRDPAYRLVIVARAVEGD